jgi:multiple sugar transport system substrate-binding protein
MVEINLGEPAKNQVSAQGGSAPGPNSEPFPPKADQPLAESANRQPVFNEMPLSAFQATEDESTGERETSGGLKSKLPLIIIVVLAGLFVLGLVKVVIPRFKKAPPPIELTYWGLWEPDEVLQGVINEYEMAHPGVKINYQFQSSRDYRERLQSALARNEGPDLFRYHITWLPMLKNELEAVPASVLTGQQLESSFYPVATSNLRTGANYLGLPLEIDTLALFYNENLFQQAGKTPPKNWDELRQLASSLTIRGAEGRILTSGVALGTTGNVDHWSDILALMMLQNGADLTRPTDRLAEDALNWYTLFNKTDRVWNETLPNSTLAFATGKVAMYFGFSWDVFEIQNINKNLQFKVVPAPQLPGTDISWASFWVEGVAKKSQHSQEAWNFLQYLASPEVLEKLFQAESNLRAFGEPYSRVEMADKILANPLAAPFVSQAAKAKTWYLCSRTFDNGINDKMIKYFEDAVNAVNSGKTAKEALATTASGVAQLLSQYGLASRVVR